MKKWERGDEYERDGEGDLGGWENKNEKSWREREKVDLRREWRKRLWNGMGASIFHSGEREIFIFIYRKEGK